MIDELSFHWVTSIPTFFVYGGKSDYVTETDRDDAAEQFTAIDFAEIEGAGHWVHAAQPQAFFEVLSDYLND